MAEQFSPIDINSVNQVFLCGIVADIAQWPEDNKAVTLLTTSVKKNVKNTVSHQVIFEHASRCLSLNRARMNDIMYVKGRIIRWYRPVPGQDPTGITVEAEDVVVYPAVNRLVPENL